MNKIKNKSISLCIITTLIFMNAFIVVEAKKNKSIKLNDGGDIYTTTNLNSELTGGDGDDIITITKNMNSEIESKEGNDNIRIEGNANKKIKADKGNDTIFIGGNSAEIELGEGNDVLLVNGISNKDIKGGKGDDIMCVSDFTKKIKGEDGFDTVYIKKGLASWKIKKIDAENIIEVSSFDGIDDCLGIVTEKVKDPLESENLYGMIGEIEDDSSSSEGKAVKASAGIEGAGTMQFGPYITDLENGKAYKAAFKLKVDSNSSTEEIAMIEVYDYKTGYREFRTIRGVDFTSVGEYQEFVIDFEMPDSENIEYRVHFYDIQDLWSDKVIVNERTGDELIDSLPVYQSERLYAKTSEVIKDTNATDGLARSFNMDVDTAEWMQWGPYKMKGVDIGSSYIANFKIKTDDNTNDNVIAIINVYNLDKGLDDRIELRGTDFDSSNTYQTFSMNFDVLDKDLMEFRIYATGNGNIISDEVSISK